MGWKEDAIQCAIDAEAHERAEQERLAREATQRRIDAAVEAANHVGVPVWEGASCQIFPHGIEWKVDGVVVKFFADCSKALTLYHEALGYGNRQVRDRRQLGEALRQIQEWEEKNGKPVQEEA